MIPKVFDAAKDESIPPSFNAAVVAVDGRMRAPLDWREAYQRAEHFVGSGLKIMWEMDLGFEAGLTYSYTSAMQHQALGLALDHLCESLWTPFRDNTLGVILYRGTADHSRHFFWDEQQRVNFQKSQTVQPLYCSQVVVDYLKLLARRLPDALPAYALLDCGSIDDPLLLSRLVSKELYEGFTLCLKGSPFKDQEISWELGSSAKGFIARESLSIEPTGVKVGLVLPSSTQDDASLRSALENLIQQAVPFRVIPENRLTNEWDELDLLYFSQRGLSQQGERMLRGFSAAGGTTVNVCQLIPDCGMLYPSELKIGYK